jgi:uncharacterized protein with GYD domain
VLNPRTQQALDEAVDGRTGGPLLRNQWRRRMQPHNAAAVQPAEPPGQPPSEASRHHMVWAADRDEVPAFTGLLPAICPLARKGMEADHEGGTHRTGAITMPLYLTRFSYAPATWAQLIANPEDRRKAAASYVESVGGKLHGFWYAFGDHDGYTLWEAPDNVSMAAVALAISGGGALSSFDTTVLLTVEETTEALKKAGQIQYRAPGT